MPGHVKNLFCEENYEEQLVKSVRGGERLCVLAHEDEVMVRDKRILENLMMLEKSKRVVDYCGDVQTEIAAHMRKIVTDWMLEVCEDQQCQPEVFFLAVNYLDRFLSLVNIKKSQFQLLASVCILLASKFSQVVPITSEQLVIYTDNSVSVDDIRKWEIFVLEVLQWDLSAASVHSFLQIFFSRYNLDHKTRLQVQHHATVAVTEYKFLLARDSLIAGAALAAAVRHTDPDHLLTTISDISSIINTDVQDVMLCLYHMVGDNILDIIKRDDTSEKLEKERPNTPDDILNISQTEIEV